MTDLTTTPVVDLEALDLEQLRDYRRRLDAEEDRVSYWRRVVHARLDVLEAQSHSDHPLALDDLVRVLGDTGTGRSRRALLRIQAADPLPTLPGVAETWAADVDPHDPVALAETLDRLREVEGRLTAYRRALHQRIEEATDRLIELYRSDPSAALALIPAG